MKRLLFLIFGVVLLLAASHCPAAVFERDWKMPGDGLLTYDDVNRREWLDVSETLLVQFPGADIEAKYQSVLSESLPGEMFDGFIAAKRADVVAFAQSAGIDTSTRDFDTNAAPILQLIDLLGVTRSNRFGRLQARGLIDEYESLPQLSQIAFRVESIIDYDPPQIASVGSAKVIFSGIDDGKSPMATGAMLVRPAIPEPSADVILLVGLALLLVERHRIRCNF